MSPSRVTFSSPRASAASYLTLRPPSSEGQTRRFLEGLAALRTQQPTLLLGLQDRLLDFERRVALLERCLPINFKDEVDALGRALRQGQYRPPHFVYGGQDDQLEKIIRALTNFRADMARLDLGDRYAPVLFHLAKRGEEIHLEAQLAAAARTRLPMDVLRQRYVIEPHDAVLAARLAEQWLALQDEPSDTPLIELGPFLRARARAEGIDVIVQERRIASLAAVSSDALVVQAGATVPRAEAERIWVHEVFAHFLPRRRGPHSCAPLAVGTQGGADDEEGRALCLEEESGLLLVARKRDLAVRHLIATRARQDQSQLGALALRLAGQGHDVDGIARAVGRALRGGGLAREAIYLPAFLRVRRCLAANPHVELWMQWSRVSAAAAVQLDHWL